MDALTPNPAAPPLLAIGRLDHYTLIVEDAEASARFHCQVLGFRFLRIQALNTGTAEDGEYDMLNYVLGFPGEDGRVLVITEGLTENSLFNRYLRKYGPGVHHIAYVVHDLEAAVELLRAQGIEMTSREIMYDALTGLRQVFLDNGPAGYFIELIERSDTATSGVFRNDNMAGLANSMDRYVISDGEPEDAEGSSCDMSTDAFLGSAPADGAPDPSESGSWGSGDAEDSGAYVAQRITEKIREKIQEPADADLLEPAVVEQRIDVDAAAVRTFLANPANVGAWTCHKTIRRDQSRWVEVRLHGDVTFETRELADGVHYEWRRGSRRRQFTLRLTSLQSGCVVHIEIPPLPPEKLRDTVRIIEVELQLLAALLEGDPDRAGADAWRAAIDAHALKIVSRRGP